MEVKLKDATVTIKNALTWGDTQKIQAAMMSGAKMSGKAKTADDIGFDFDALAMLEAKYVALECAVKKVVDNDNKEIKFTREWMDNLSQEDGEKLEKAVDGLQGKEIGTTTS